MKKKSFNFCLFTCFHFYSPLGTEQANLALFKNSVLFSHTPSFHNQNLGNFVLDVFYELFQGEKKNAERAPGGKLCSLTKDNFLPDCINKSKNWCVELCVC